MKFIGISLIIQGDNPLANLVEIGKLRVLVRGCIQAAQF